MAQTKANQTAGVNTGLANQKWFYRLWEIIPGLTSWVVLVSPILLSLVWPVAVAYFIIAFDLFWLLKSFRMSLGLVEGYSLLKKSEKIDWRARLAELEDIESTHKAKLEKLQKFSKRGILGRKNHKQAKADYERID